MFNVLNQKPDKICDEYHINLSHSTTYYPQGNGMVDSSKKD